MAHANKRHQFYSKCCGDGVLTLVDSLVTGGTTMIAMIIFTDFRLTVIALLPLPFLALGAWKLEINFIIALISHKRHFLV